MRDVCLPYFREKLSDHHYNFSGLSVGFTDSFERVPAWIRATPHSSAFRRRRNVCLLSSGSRLPQNIAAWLWLVAIYQGWSADFAYQRAALWSKLGRGVDAIRPTWHLLRVLTTWTALLTWRSFEQSLRKLSRLNLLNADLQHTIGTSGERIQVSIVIAQLLIHWSIAARLVLI